jgi:predicted nucleic-acid-binding protein
MKLVDTVALVGFLNPDDKAHRRASEHIADVWAGNDVFVPASTLVEADLVMKVRGYTDAERKTSWGALESAIPAEKLITNSASSFRGAIVLQENGMDYFDSLITSLARESDSIVITTDKEIAASVQSEW